MLDPVRLMLVLGWAFLGFLAWQGIKKWWRDR